MRWGATRASLPIAADRAGSSTMQQIFGGGASYKQGHAAPLHPPPAAPVLGPDAGGLRADHGHEPALLRFRVAAAVRDREAARSLRAPVAGFAEAARRVRL